jgi:hypothetical protein
MTKKLELIQRALQEIGIGSQYQISPEMQEAARVRLESMMNSAPHLGYVFGDEIDAESGLKLVAEEWVVLELAIRLAPSYGKTVSAMTLRNAAIAKRVVMNAVAANCQMPVPAPIPVGAGYKAWRGCGRRFTVPPDTSPVQGNDAGNLEFGG